MNSHSLGNWQVSNESLRYDWLTLLDFRAQYFVVFVFVHRHQLMQLTITMNALYAEVHLNCHCKTPFGVRHFTYALMDSVTL